MLGWLRQWLGLSARSAERLFWTEMQTNTVETPPLSRAVTAREAYGMVELRVRGYESTAKLTAITSGEDINQTGHSDQWQLFFDLPYGQAHVIFSFVLKHVEDSATGEHREERHLVERIKPFLHPDSTLADMLRAGTVTERVVTDLWTKHLDSHPALPLPFVDSPEVVAAFAAQGEDFISGDTHLTLFSSWLPDGSAVWRSIAYDVEYYAPFALES